MPEEIVGCVIVLAMYFVFVIVLIVLWKLLDLGGKPSIRDMYALYDEARHISHKIIVTGMIFKTALIPSGIRILFLPVFGFGTALIASVCSPNIAPFTQMLRQLLLDFYSFYLQLRGIEPKFQ